MKTPAQQAYALLRATMGLDMFLHGATRIWSGVETFAGPVVKEFQATMLPPGLVHLYAVTLPFVEGGIGLFLIIGLFTRQTVILASFLMMSLIFGTARCAPNGIPWGSSSGIRSFISSFCLRLAITALPWIRGVVRLHLR